MKSSPPLLDAVIVGQGLVGSLLAFCMIRNGLRVMVLDQGHQTSSTRVAAGLINPLLGKRLSLHDDFESFYQQATGLYQIIEKETQTSFFETIDQLRAIDKQPSEKNWLDVTSDPRKKKWVGASALQSPFNQLAYAVGSVRGTAVIHTTVLLHALKQWLTKHSSYANEKIDVQAIDFTQPTPSIGQYTAKHIIFCEGAAAAKNPIWSDLPWALAKGDILTLAPLPLARQAYIWGSWLVPGQGENFRLGSTFDWDALDTIPNVKHRSALVEKLNKAMPNVGEVQVVDHQSGIRPSTQNRQVFVGKHPKKTQAIIFNGMGSKGCLLAPHYAGQLSQWIVQGQVPVVGSIG